MYVTQMCIHVVVGCLLLSKCMSSNGFYGASIIWLLHLAIFDLYLIYSRRENPGFAEWSWWVVRLQFFFFSPFFYMSNVMCFSKAHIYQKPLLLSVTYRNYWYEESCQWNASNVNTNSCSWIISHPLGYIYLSQILVEFLQLISGSQFTL